MFANTLLEAKWLVQCANNTSLLLSKIFKTKCVLLICACKYIGYMFRNIPLLALKLSTLWHFH